MAGLFGIAATLAPTTAAEAATVGRIAGEDRYATAAAVSTSFVSGVPVAFVATGENFPDALAAGPAGVRAGGPVLLTRPADLPSSTATELDRLDPANIVVLGGAGIVGDGVMAQLQQYTTGTVTRVAGSDRYETAAAIAANFPVGVPLVYVASGLTFPDALAAGPVAGANGGPLLLVDPSFIPPATAAQLDRLDPGVIIVAGGTTAVSSSVRDQLLAYSPVVLREFGSDRYATAVDISANSFSPGVDTVFLATGTNFPDALAGGPRAGLANSPVLLSRPDCIPVEVMNEINRLGPDDIVLLGGTSALSDSIAALVVCPDTPPPPQPPPPPPGPATTFGDGTYVVGSQLPAGTYRTRAPAQFCYWERLRGFSGTLDDIIANSFSNAHQVVTIDPTDAGFSTDDCGVWTSDLSPLTSSPSAPFGDGTWIVGSDIAAGTWSAPGADDCYWERRSGFGGRLADVIANDFGSVNPVVTIAASDAGFYAEDCGTWSLLG